MKEPSEVEDFTWYEVDITDWTGCINADEMGDAPYFESLDAAKNYAKHCNLKDNQALFISKVERTVLERRKAKNRLSKPFFSYSGSKPVLTSTK